jgi:hypothetical protein
MLQSEAGYIDARPQPPTRLNSLATHGRTIHWVIYDQFQWDLPIGPFRFTQERTFRQRVYEYTA